MKRKESGRKIRCHGAQPLWNVSPEAKVRIEANTQPAIRHWITTVLADVTFVDDACFSFEADNPVSLVDIANALLQIVSETCEAHMGSCPKAVQTTVGRRQEGTLHFHEDGQTC